MKLDLHCAALATDDEDINWVPFLVIAHEQEAMVSKPAVKKLVHDFYDGWSSPELMDLHEDAPDEYDDQRFEAFLDFCHMKGYTVLNPGHLDWFVPHYYANV